MRVLIVLLLVVLLAVSVSSESSLKIIAGHRIKDGQFPFLVRLVLTDTKNDETGFCSGSLVAPDIVMTAAHCFSGDLKHTTVQVSAGIDNPINQTSKKFTIHPDWNHDEFIYDVAYVTLPEAYNMTKSVGLIALADETVFSTQSGSDKNGTILYAAGFGNTQNDSQAPSLGQFVGNIPYLNFSYCDEANVTNTFIQNVTICAGGYHEDTCQGDSGGPLFYTNKINDTANGKTYQVGITSYGTGCGLGLPGIYSDVPGFAKAWIEEELGINTDVPICGDGKITAPETCDDASACCKHCKKQKLNVLCGNPLEFVPGCNIFVSCRTSAKP